jgi:hypothetical protein
MKHDTTSAGSVPLVVGQPEVIDVSAPGDHQGVRAGRKTPASTVIARDPLLGNHNTKMADDWAMTDRMHAIRGDTPTCTPTRRPPAPARLVDRCQSAPTSPSRGPPRRDVACWGHGRLVGPAADVPGAIPQPPSRATIFATLGGSRAGDARVVLNAGRCRPSGRRAGRLLRAPDPAACVQVGPAVGESPVEGRVMPGRLARQRYRPDRYQPLNRRGAYRPDDHRVRSPPRGEDDPMPPADRAPRRGQHAVRHQPGCRLDHHRAGRPG